MGSRVLCGTCNRVILLPANLVSLLPQQGSCLALLGTVGTSITFVNLLFVLLTGSGAGAIPFVFVWKCF